MKVLKDTVSMAKIIAQTNSKIFSIVFTKSDGSERKMLAKVGVKRYLSKNPNKRKVKTNNNIVKVFDMEIKEYRSIKLDTIKHFSCGNIVIGEKDEK